MLAEKLPKDTGKIPEKYKKKKKQKNTKKV